MTQQADRKQETREKVLRAAGAALRQHGPDGVGIADIMRQAGLTHGGFYAHFKNKDDLVAQSLTYVFARMQARSARLEGALPRAEQLAAYLDRYVSTAHRDNPARGCPLTTLGNDIARQPAAVRHAFDQGVHMLAAKIESLLPDGASLDRAALANSMLAEMAGAVMLSRAVSCSLLSESILANARASLRARAGLPPQRQEPAYA